MLENTDSICFVYLYCSICSSLLATSASPRVELLSSSTMVRSVFYYLFYCPIFWVFHQLPARLMALPSSSAVLVLVSVFLVGPQKRASPENAFHHWVSEATKLQDWSDSQTVSPLSSLVVALSKLIRGSVVLPGGVLPTVEWVLSSLARQDN